MVKFRAYSKMYMRGKPITRPYVTLDAPTMVEAKKKANAYNRSWNKLYDNRVMKLKAKVVKIKKVKR